MTIEELNDTVDSGEIDEFIQVCEARQRKELSKIADRITGRGGVRLVLLAGGSSAGKTTTAKRLCTQLRVNDAVAMHLSTDDYFVGDARNPRGPDGEFDYETIECVDMPRLAADLNALFRQEVIHPRRFDFVRHEGFDAETTAALPENGIVVLEGLHALNPRLTAEVDDAVKFRLFIEPKDQIEVFATTKVPVTDARLLRRIVRDNRFRKMDPQKTFDMWPKVLAGEEKWINPFRGAAEAEFDSALPYELAVLKLYAQGLLEMVLRRNPLEGRAIVLREILNAVHATDPTKVPGDSILRETIGGSLLDY